MVSSTDTTVELPSIHTVTKDQIYLFCKTTQDDNKVHQGDNPVVPGFYLDAKVKNFFDQLAKARNPNMHLAGLDAKFHDMILKDEGFFLRAEEIYDEKSGVITYKMAVVKPEVLQPDGSTKDVNAVVGSVKYSLNPVDPRTARLDGKFLPYTKTGKSYELSPEILEGVRQSLKLSRPDKIMTAVSLTSHALQTDKESYDVLFDETLVKERYPYFAKHDLIVYQGLETLPESAKFTIHVKPGTAKMGLHPAYARATDTSGRPLFDLTCTIMFHEQKTQ
jgi:hypothetical protein